MVHLLETLEHQSRRTLILVGLAALGLVGLVDYLTGFEIMFSVFYLLEVGWPPGTWAGGSGW